MVSRAPVPLFHDCQPGLLDLRKHLFQWGIKTVDGVMRSLTGHRYLTGESSESTLFLGKSGYPLNRDSLRQVIHAIGEKAGVHHAFPHRFRHSFAIQYLRSGGDIFTLKEMLGHNSLEMVQHYARVADVDVEEAHRKASPADNWRL